jgi:hypothetical protein
MDMIITKTGINSPNRRHQIPVADIDALFP